jgi:hypothetical protein
MSDPFYQREKIGRWIKPYRALSEAPSRDDLGGQSLTEK